MDTLTIITTIIAALNTAGIIGGGMWYLKETKRHKNAEAAQVETNNAIAAGNEWQEIARVRGEQIEKLNKTIDDRWADKNSDRDKIFDLMSASNQKDLQIQSLTFRLCNRKGCIEREPQTGF